MKKSRRAMFPVVVLLLFFIAPGLHTSACARLPSASSIASPAGLPTGRTRWAASSFPAAPCTV